MSNLHWEALRKQRVVDRKLFIEKEREKLRQSLADQNRKELEEYAKFKNSDVRALNTKRLGEMLPCGRGEYHRSQDPVRRQDFFDSNKDDFNAKINNRYSSINYAQQW